MDIGEQYRTWDAFMAIAKAGSILTLALIGALVGVVALEWPLIGVLPAALVFMYLAGSFIGISARSLVVMTIIMAVLTPIGLLFP